MPEARDLLIEIGTEELPPKALPALSEALERNLREGFERVGIVTGSSRRYATPRRLAVLIDAVPARGPDRRVERRGPALAAAFDAAGRPTRAALGFARACGVPVETLTTLETDKGAWLAQIRTEPGAAVAELLPELLETALSGLPIPRYMRWGAGEAAFVRPVHWLVLLFGEEVVPATVLGVRAGRETRGHRFHHPEGLAIASAADYAALLETEGRVIADFDARRRRIREQAEDAAAAAGGRAVIADELLDEVTALVEWPTVLVGGFEPRFLEVPAEALITTLQSNQKCFPLVDPGGRLLPSFVAVSNLESRDPAQVRAGYERVIRPRFADAEFFWNQDRRQRLANRLEALKAVVFQQRLGSLYDKSARVATLARWVAERIGADPDRAERAGWLAKCDLLTEMVQEFPELQGIMGHHYARHDGEPAEVAEALEEQYRPRFAGDDLPQTGTGQALALADRLDTLVGIFAIGQAPTGAKDPFALRRAALGVLRISIERELDLDLAKLLDLAAQDFRPDLEAPAAAQAVLEFLLERLRGYYLEQGFGSDELEAVLACRPTRALDFDRRLRAVAAFRRLPEAESLAAANKRIRNILRQADGETPAEVRAELLSEESERDLAERLAVLSAEVAPLLEGGHYQEALHQLARLREPVDRFFDAVLVMADDPALRCNRIALLGRMSGLFSQVADFSRLQS